MEKSSAEIIFSQQVFPFKSQCGWFYFEKIAKRITKGIGQCHQIQHIIYAEITSGCLAHNLDANFYVITEIKSFIHTKRLLCRCLRWFFSSLYLKGASWVNTQKEFQNKCEPQIDFQSTTPRTRFFQFARIATPIFVYIRLKSCGNFQFRSNLIGT